MSTANKLTYLNTTKGKIKDAINLTGANILSEDTFRSYADKLKQGLVDAINDGGSTIYSNFPKTTQTGTEIALNDTYEVPMEIGLNGNTHQDSYTGKNFFNKYGDFTYGNNRHQTTLNELGQLVSTANFSSGRSSGLLIENLSQNTNYSFSGILISANGTGTKSNAVIEIMSTTSSVIYREQINPSVTKPYNFSFTFNTGSNTSLWVSLSGVNATSGGTTETVFDNLQLELGSATSYEPFVGGIPSPNPDYPQPIEVVTGDNTINIHGENLLDNSNPTSVASTATWTPTETGGIISNSVAWGAGVQWNFKLDTTKQYTLSVNSTANQVYFYIRTYTDSTYSTIKTRVLSDGTGNVRKTFIPDSEYISFSILHNAPLNNISISNMQLENSSSFTEYEPYQSKDYEISLGSIELCKIGDYQDYIYKENNKWYKHSEIGKLNVDTSTITIRSNYTNIEYAEITKPNDFIGKGNYDDYNVYCSHAISDIKSAIQYAWDSTYRIGKITNKASVNALWLGFSKGTGLDNIKTALNGAVIYYALATPTNTEITDDNLIEQLEELEKAKSVDDKTFISQINEQLPFILDVSALSKN